MTVPADVTKYDLHDLVTLRATYVSTDLVTTADPSYVICYVKNPSAVVASYPYGVAGASVTRQATGAYFKDITLDVVGKWYYRWEGTGLLQAAEEWTLVCERTFVL